MNQTNFMEEMQRGMAQLFNAFSHGNQQNMRGNHVNQVNMYNVNVPNNPRRNQAYNFDINQGNRVLVFNNNQEEPPNDNGLSVNEC